MSPVARKRIFWLLAIVLVVLAAGGVYAVTKSDDKKEKPPAASNVGGRDPRIAAEVPKSIREKGVLLVASDATYPPNEFIENGKVVGMNADLATAVARVMGLKVQIRNVTFDAIIPNLVAKKYDAGFSSFTDTKEREQVVDFVTYFSAGTSFYVKASESFTLNSLEDLCGRTVAVEKGTTQADDATAQSKTCTDGNKSAVTVLTFPDQNGANLAISSGRAEVGMADSPVAAYLVKQSNGVFKLAGTPYGTAPYGIALPKGLGLNTAMKDAVLKIMKTGKYRRILKKWGVEQGAISSDQVKINGAIN